MKNAARKADIVWLTPKGERERSEDERGLQLSRSQKWDLVRICLATVASAAFFSAPFVLSAPQPSAGPSSVGVQQTAGVQDAPGRVAVVTADIAVPVTSVLIQPLQMRSNRSGIQPSHRSAASRNAPAAESASFARRLGRAIAGDGRYQVRPFPALDAHQD